MTKSRQKTNSKTRKEAASAEKKPLRIRKYMQTKLALAFFIVAAALSVCVGRLFYIVAVKGDSYSKTVLAQQNYNSTVIPFRRGTITDRNQTVLATSEPVYNLILDPSQIMGTKTEEKDLEVTLQALSDILGLDADEIRELFETKSGSSYVRVKSAKQLPEDTKSTFEEYMDTYNDSKADEAGEIKGIWFEMEYKRTYPYDSLACTVLGFSGTDSSMGNWGIEQYYNDYLTGINGRSYGYLTSDGTVERTTHAAEAGNTIISTIDYTIQSTTEEILADFCAEVTAENVGILVMDPNNGEILAMATSSVYDLNNPMDLSAYYTEEEQEAMTDSEKSEFLNHLWRNFMISDTFEPGSTAKAFTEAAALEENIADADTTYYCDGGQQLARDTYVRCSHYHDTIDFKQALAYSCNDAMMQMSKAMGKEVFCQYQDLFGLGKLTGIDLPGEASGLLYSEENMSVVDLGTNSFGQNFTVTMVQMAAAYCSILNGGNYYQPHIVKQVLTADGEVVENVGTSVVRETVSAQTSEILREALGMCVMEDSSFATGKKARIEGFTVGGKTGTAEKYPRGNGEYLLSFIGFTNIDNPEVLVYVIVDNPQSESETYSAAVAVELVQKVMSSVVDYMNIPAVDSDAWKEAKAAAEAEAALEASREAEEAETDEEGNSIESTESADEESSAESEGQTTEEDEGEVIPEGGILSGDDGPPQEESTEETSTTIALEDLIEDGDE